MNQTLIPVILAGGKGERFWPLSRRKRPKQFLSLDGSGQSLLQTTGKRLLDLAGGWQDLWVITADLLAEGVREQLPNLPLSNLLVEPEGKDTAPAVAWATLKIAQIYGLDAVIGFFPADHWIGNQEAFVKTLQSATHVAATQEAIVTLGISPNYPATGYGYIQQGESKGEVDGFPVYRIHRFTEKPDRLTAESFLHTGGFSWNSGMFVFRAGVMLQELHTYVPEIISLLEDHEEKAYRELPKISIDYAVMEKTRLAYVLPADFGWDDLGDWNAIERLRKGETENVELARHVGLDTLNCLFYAQDEAEVIVTIGIEDLVVIRDGNVTLIAHKARTQEIKQVLKSLANDTQLGELL
ncbi:mannose-1-phosphate guanylyltransferase [Gloeocapsa sp. PCC 73106]|uniref:mannose-1-phosphate guanylyltransferase n=1 Tax=Gloeocapsa sp. PCC 73106 TaxID=102232 RepID=UPI0002ABFFD3|nr:mannose-1-phosphate guanylyltransferase [Gloeocapsa sp. PCC 73106]ELR99944.1 mannose-1-phosphate guanylyltransferase [Gloeocapsa sp. PCC 73106]